MQTSIAKAIVAVSNNVDDAINLISRINGHQKTSDIQAADESTHSHFFRDGSAIKIDKNGSYWEA